MNFKTQKVAVSLGSEFDYHSADDKMLWALINDAIKRGEEVPARITAVTTSLDQTTLGHRGEDSRGLPVFCIVSGTKISLRVQLQIDVNVPHPEAPPPAAQPPMPSQALAPG